MKDEQSERLTYLAMIAGAMLLIALALYVLHSTESAYGMNARNRGAICLQ